MMESISILTVLHDIMIPVYCEITMTMVFPSTWTYTVQTCPFSEGKPRGCFDICYQG